MYDFLTSFVIYDICMWIFGCDLSWAWRMGLLDSRLPIISISWIAMVILGYFHYLFLVGSHVSLALVELLVLEALVGQPLWKPCNNLG